MDSSTIAPYIVSILASIISGISSYLVARNKSASDIQALLDFCKLSETVRKLSDTRSDKYENLLLLRAR